MLEYTEVQENPALGFVSVAWRVDVIRQNRLDSNQNRFSDRMYLTMLAMVQGVHAKRASAQARN